MDRVNGWNLMRDEMAKAALEELHHRRPCVAMFSPPCTTFSKLMDVKWARMSAEKPENLVTEGGRLLDVAAWVMQFQLAS